jgi:hypothetical protein
MKKLIFLILTVFIVSGLAADNYQKVFIDAAGKYKIKYIPAKGKPQFVNENQDLFQAWLNDGNSPEEIPFVASPPAPPASLEKKKGTVFRMITNKQNSGYDAGFEFKGKTFPSDSQYREFMLTGVRIAQKALADGEEVNINAFTQGGELVTLTAQELLDLQKAYDTYSLAVYNLYIAEVAKWKLAIESEIDYYIKNGKFEE